MSERFEERQVPFGSITREANSGEILPNTEITEIRRTNSKAGTREYTWSSHEGIMQMQHEARACFEEFGDISIGVMKKNEMTRLASAVNKFYPGGWTQLREDIDVPFVYKPKGHWDEDAIRSEAQRVLQEHGKLTISFLHELGKTDLAAAIGARYPGRMTQLKSDIGSDIGLSPKPYKYWTPEKVMDEARTFVEKHGELSTRVLEGNGRKDLASALSKHFPGGIRAARLHFVQSLAEQDLAKPRGFWNEETIEAHAREIFEEHGQLSTPLLTALGEYGLLNAIIGKYPGKLRGLRKKLTKSDAAEQEKNRNDSIEQNIQSILQALREE